MNKKKFFKNESKAQIRKKSFVNSLRLSEVLGLAPQEFTTTTPLVPECYETARKFYKHGPEVKLVRFRTRQEAKSAALRPVDLRQMAFDNISMPFFSGYSFMPLGRDRRKRKVSLVECVEGARLFAYANQIQGANIDIKNYSDAKRVALEGSYAIARVPSRTEKFSRHELRLSSIPMIDTKNKYAIVSNINSDHSCSSKRFNFRYTYTNDHQTSDIVQFCAHDIAAYLQLVNNEVAKNNNSTPLEMCPFAIPTQLTVDFYLGLENNVLVEDKNLHSKDQLRRLNKAEKEIALWSLVEDLGFYETFYSSEPRDGVVREYKWSPNAA